MNRLLAFLFILCCSCEKILFEEEPKTNSLAVFDQLWTEFRLMYGPFEERGVNWDMVGDKYRPLVTPTTGDDELFTILSQMLTELNDGHVRLTAPNKPIFQSNKVFREKIDDDLFDLELIKDNYLVDDYKQTQSYTYGLIDDSILYIHLLYINDQAPILEKVIDQYPHVKGLIIDLRHGRGGDFHGVFLLYPGSRIRNAWYSVLPPVMVRSLLTLLPGTIGI